MNSIEPDQWAVTPYSSIREKKQVSITDINPIQPAVATFVAPGL